MFFQCWGVGRGVSRGCMSENVRIRLELLGSRRETEGLSLARKEGRGWSLVGNACKRLKRGGEQRSARLAMETKPPRRVLGVWARGS